MLQSNQVVRQAIERLYRGTCTVTVRKEYEKENGSTGYRNEVVLENQPCHLSKSNISSTQSGEVAASVSQTMELFISPDVDIPPGSIITVTQNGETVDYKRSGVKAKYDSHQEIMVELCDRWS